MTNLQKETCFIELDNLKGIKFNFLLLYFFAVGIGLACSSSLALAIDYSVNAITGSWKDTGLVITAGQKIKITASGRWCWGSGANDCSGPLGVSSDLVPCPTADCSPIPMLLDGSNIGGLVGRIGDSVFGIGSSYSLTSSSNGSLSVAFNDWLGHYSDNSGSISMSVSIYNPTVGPINTPPENAPPEDSTPDILLQIVPILASLKKSSSGPSLPQAKCCEQYDNWSDGQYIHKCYYDGYIEMRAYRKSDGWCTASLVYYYPTDPQYHYTNLFHTRLFKFLDDKGDFPDRELFGDIIKSTLSEHFTEMESDSEKLSFQKGSYTNGEYSYDERFFCDKINGTYNDAINNKFGLQGCPTTSSQHMGVQPPPRDWEESFNTSPNKCGYMDNHTYIPDSLWRP